MASAGNDGNDPLLRTAPHYPAAYPFVLGVGALNEGGSGVADFSCTGINAKVYAPGVAIRSTLLQTKYQSWSGTSMAAPVMSGIAALVIGYHHDQPQWTPDMIFSQLANQGSNLENCLMEVPKPDIVYVSTQVIDAAPFGNGDGVLDSGETADLMIMLQNNYGHATDVTATLRSVQPEPWVTIIDDQAQWGSIGPRAQNDNLSDHFRIQVNPATPNNYQAVFELDIKAKNLNGDDFAWTREFKLTIRNGKLVSGVLAMDEHWTTDSLIIATSNLLVPIGGRLTIDPGVRVEFDGKYYLVIRGEIRVNGTADKPVYFLPRTGGQSWSHVTWDTIAPPIVPGDNSTGSFINHAYFYNFTTLNINCAVGFNSTTFSGLINLWASPGTRFQESTFSNIAQGDPNLSTISAGATTFDRCRFSEISSPGMNYVIGLGNCEVTHCIFDRVQGSIWCNCFANTNIIKDSTFTFDNAYTTDGTPRSTNFSGDFHRCLFDMGGSLGLGGNATQECTFVSDLKSVILSNPSTSVVDANLIT